MSKTLIIVIIAVLVIGAGVAGYLYYKKKQAPAA